MDGYLWYVFVTNRIRRATKCGIIAFRTGVCCSKFPRRICKRNTIGIAIRVAYGVIVIWVYMFTILTWVNWLYCKVCTLNTFKSTHIQCIPIMCAAPHMSVIHTRLEKILQVYTRSCLHEGIHRFFIEVSWILMLPCLSWKEGRNWVLRRFQQLRPYRDEIETRNREEIPYSSRIVPRGLSVAERP